MMMTSGPVLRFAYGGPTTPGVIRAIKRHAAVAMLTICFSARVALGRSVRPAASERSPAYMTAAWRDGATVPGGGGMLGANSARSIFNVKQYGAKGDGITDDTGAVQAAVNAAVSKGGDVYLPLGKFLIRGTIRVTFNGPPNIMFLGSGPSTILVHPTPGDTIRVQTRPFTVFRGFKAANFVIDCKNGPGSGLHLQNILGSILENIYVKDCNGTSASAGFWLSNLHGWTEETNAVHLYASNNSLNFRFTSHGTPAEQSFGYSSLDIYCEGNKGISSMSGKTSVCLQTEGNAMVYNSFIKIRANEGNYLLSALGSSSMVGDDFDIVAESTTPALPVAFNIAPHAAIGGTFSHINLLNFKVLPSSFPGGVFNGSAGVQYSGTYGTGFYTGPTILLRGAGTSAGVICDVPSRSEACGIFIGPNGSNENFVIQRSDHPGVAPYLSIAQPSGDTTVMGKLSVNGTHATIMSGSATPSGKCHTGSLYLNTGGKPGSTLFVCVAGAWVDVK